MTDAFEVNENSDVYYAGTYWNDFEVVRDRINERISGDPARTWHQHFGQVTDKTFKRALILNCGNGWVERELIQHGLIAEAVGMDYSQDLLEEATAAAREAGLPLTYQQANVNTGAFPSGEFDLVVNHAAAHHIASIDRVFREACRILPDDGWFVSFDYVGPHRNQYRLDAWEEAWKLNEELPASLRQDMVYPPIHAMLVIDPTEAIHSELILETFERYFTNSEFAPLGGAIAYPLLTHNARMFAAADDAERAHWINRILAVDNRFLAEHPDSSLFAYFAGTPRKSVLQEDALLAEWEAHEVQRERSAQENGGEYYVRGPLSVALLALEQEQAARQGAEAQVAQLQSELQAIRGNFWYPKIKRALDAEATRRVRQNGAVRRVEQLVRGARPA
jgi:SAM-dependent methyltransferase